MPNKNTETKITHPKLNREPFYRLFKIFESNILLHEASIETIGSYAIRYDKNANKKILSLIKGILKRKRRGQKIKISDLGPIINATKKYHPKQSDLFAKNTLVSMVTTLDSLFSALLKYYYREHPEKLSIENKSIVFSDLKKIKNIEDAQDFLIKREVEMFLLDNGFKNRLNVLDKEMGIGIPENNQHIKDIRKLVKIRNLIIHNECRTDEEFVSLYGEEKNKKGEVIKINPEYLMDSLALIYFIGSYILQLAQIKFSTKPIKSDDFILNDAMHRLLKKGLYAFLRPMYDLGIKEKFFDDLNRKMMIVNYCIGLKKQGKNNEHIKKVLEIEDWSSADNTIKMVLEALQGNDNAFFVALKKLIRSGSISKEELQEWEIFSFYKKRPEFKKIQARVI